MLCDVNQNQNQKQKPSSFLHALSNYLASSSSSSPKPCSTSNSMLKLASRFCCGLRRPKIKIKITMQQHMNNKNTKNCMNGHHPEPISHHHPVRVATFNAAMFSMAPAVPLDHPVDIRGKAANDHHRPPTKGILKQHKFSASMKRRVSINLPEDEISMERSKTMLKGKAISSHSTSTSTSTSYRSESWRFGERSVLDVLKEVGADIIALQNVKAEEEKAMRPLSDLADGLGMKYVFAESWAPEYGNAILSRWPIKQWRVHKICDDTDFRLTVVN